MLMSVQTFDERSTLDRVTKLLGYLEAMKMHNSLDFSSVNCIFDDLLSMHAFTFGPPRTEKHITISESLSKSESMLLDIQNILNISMDIKFDMLLVF